MSWVCLTLQDVLYVSDLIIFNTLFDMDQEEPLEVDNLMKALKDAIGKAMPAQIMSWQQTCEAHDQGKITK